MPNHPRNGSRLQVAVSGNGSAFSEIPLAAWENRGSMGNASLVHPIGHKISV